ncbi:Ankyrin repeats (3 copies) [Carpediemonas membranifera]|uniref:Ankyrin repeats (3 copies) n=1 Tax=Carpediemonas membranifera TaxID=201153 RepID=A0A8J6B681_9EUKA|nr:Ankyrin repeats (3 copies) [Carpediemonas membranifera]|eukprot:KAG9393929.1 Ankyrin repeats (3 copies) [Carpediemonas membranifera]
MPPSQSPTYAKTKGPRDNQSLIDASAKGDVALVGALLLSKAHPDLRGLAGRTALIEASAGGNMRIVELLTNDGAGINLQDEDGCTALMAACENGHVDVVRVLLDRGADCTKALLSNGRTALYLASFFGHADIAELLLDAAANMVDVTNKDGKSPLYAASVSGHARCARLLLDRGADVSHPSDLHDNPLIAAACWGHVEIIELLLDAGAILDLQNDEGFTALMLTCLGSHAECTRSLLAAGADCTKVHSSGCSALCIAAENGFVEIASLLLDANRSMVDIADNDSWSPLFWAAAESHLDLARLLLEHGANPNHRANDGRTPLMAATLDNNVEIIELLIKCGWADLSMRDGNSLTALDLACIRGHVETVTVLVEAGSEYLSTPTPLVLAAFHNQVAIVELLLNAGATLDLQRKDGRTALMVACVNGHADSAGFLVSAGADCTKVSSTGASALYLAALFGFAGIVKLLLDANQSMINVANKDGSTPLHASADGHIDVVRLLIDRGANLDCRANDGRTPLMAAAINNHVEIIKLLADSGATLDLQRKDGRTALMVACVNGHADSAGFLVSAGADCTKVSSTGASALYLAALFGFAGIVKLLLDANQSMINVANKDGSTPLHASADGHIDVVRLLIDRGANLDCRANDGRTPLMAAAINNHVEIIKLLADSGATLDLRETDGTTALTNACINGHRSSVLALLEAGASVSFASVYGTCLKTAAEQGYDDIILMLLQYGADVNAAGGFRITALHAAVMANRTSCVRLLLRAGCNVNARDRLGRTATFMAAHGGNDEILAMLIAAGADVTIPARSSLLGRARRPRKIAQAKGHERCVALLDKPAQCGPLDFDVGSLQFRSIRPPPTRAMLWDTSMNAMQFSREVFYHGDAPLATGLFTFWTVYRAYIIETVTITVGPLMEYLEQRYNGQSPLQDAARSGNIDLLRYFATTSPGKINCTDNNGRSPLFTASQHGHTTCAQFLIDHGADPNQCSKTGFTCLISATIEGFSDVVRVLLVGGADPTNVLPNGRSALHVAAQNGFTTIIRRLLGNEPKLVDIVDSYGKTALIYACSKGYAETAQLLLDAGANASYSCNSGTCLSYAAHFGHADLILLLLQCGAEVDALVMSGSTALHKAAQAGRASCVRLLLQAGCDVNARSRSGSTAALLAAEKGHFDILRLLIGAGADITIPRGDRKARDVARSNGHGDCVYLLDNPDQFPVDIKPGSLVIHPRTQRPAKTRSTGDVPVDDTHATLPMKAKRALYVEANLRRTRRLLAEFKSTSTAKVLEANHNSTRLLEADLARLSPVSSLHMDPMPLLEGRVREALERSDTMHSFVVRGDVRRMRSRKLLRSGKFGPVVLNCLDWEGRSPLYNAFVHNQPQAFAALLKAGCLLDDAFPDGHPLLAVITKPAILDEMLMAKVNVNVISRGTTALVAAIQGGHVDSARKLLSHGADPLLPADGVNAMHAIRAFPDTVVAKGLLCRAHGMHPHLVDAAVADPPPAPPVAPFPVIAGHDSELHDGFCLGNASYRNNAGGGDCAFFALHNLDPTIFSGYLEWTRAAARALLGSYSAPIDLTETGYTHEELRGMFEGKNFVNLPALWAIQLYLSGRVRAETVGQFELIQYACASAGSSVHRSIERFHLELSDDMLVLRCTCLDQYAVSRFVAFAEGVGFSHGHYFNVYPTADVPRHAGWHRPGSEQQHVSADRGVESDETVHDNHERVWHGKYGNFWFARHHPYPVPLLRP